MYAINTAMNIEPTVSIVVPSKNEVYLQKTIQDLLAKSEGQIEVIAVLDSYWPSPKLIDDDRLVVIHSGRNLGMRGAINSGVAIAKGKYILKCDAHCMFDRGFDIKLSTECDSDWVVIPRRKRLDARNWILEKTNKPDVDYEYLSKDLHGKIWEERTKNRVELLIDDNMSAQGSCWFMSKAYYAQLELEDEENYGTFSNEFQEIGLKCWLSGGRVVINKKTWYAHLHKDKEMGRGYSIDKGQLEKGTNYANRWLTNTAWHKQTLPFNWLIEKFWPVPGWPEDKTKWNTPI